jgi:hypothetical protein
MTQLIDREYSNIMPGRCAESEQVRHNENDFDAEFTAAVSDSLGQGQVVRVGQVIDVVPHLNGFVVIEDSPRKLRATQDALLAIDSSVIDIERLCSTIAFGVLRLSARLLFVLLTLVLVFVLKFVSSEAISSR